MKELWLAIQPVLLGAIAVGWLDADWGWGPEWWQTAFGVSCVVTCVLLTLGNAVRLYERETSA